MENSQIYSRIFQKSREKLEISRDFIIPDLYGDIKRIIGYSGSLSPEECYTDSGKANVSGTLTVRILFVDDENKLRGVTFTEDYFSGVLLMANDFPYGEDIVFSCPTLDNLTVKTVNPRKVSIRAQIDPCLKVWKSLSLVPEIARPENIGVSDFEMKKENLKCIKPYVLCEKDLELSENVSLDSTASEIIFYDAKIEVASCTPAENSDGISVNVKGSIGLDIIYSPTDGAEPVLFHRDLPFSQTLSGGEKGSALPICRACAYIRTFDCTLSQEASSAEVDIAYVISVNGAESIACDYYSDIYLPGYTMKCESEKRIPTYEMFKSSKTLRVQCSKESSASDAVGIMMTSVNPTLNMIEKSGDGETAYGSSQINVIFREGDGSCHSQSFSCNFEADLETLPKYDEYLSCLRVSDVSARFENGNLSVGYDLEITLILWENVSVDPVLSAEVGEKKDYSGESAFTLYYPQKNETFWDIGKKYGVSAKELEKSNAVPENVESKTPAAVLIMRKK